MDITNIGAYTDFLTSQNSSANKISEDIKSADYTKADEEEMLNACKKFEAYFLEQVFKEMEKTVDVLKDENSTSSFSSGMLDYFGDQTIQQLADTSTETQGLGLAQQLFEQMKRNYGLS